MTNLNDLTTGQILQIIAIKEQIEGLQSQIDSIASAGGGETPIPPPTRRNQRKRNIACRVPGGPRLRLLPGHAGQDKRDRTSGFRQASPKETEKNERGGQGEDCSGGPGEMEESEGAGKTTL